MSSIGVRIVFVEVSNWMTPLFLRLSSDASAGVTTSFHVGSSTLIALSWISWVLVEGFKLSCHNRDL